MQKMQKMQENKQDPEDKKIASKVNANMSRYVMKERNTRFHPGEISRSSLGHTLEGHSGHVQRQPTLPKEPSHRF